MVVISNASIYVQYNSTFGCTFGGPDKDCCREMFHFIPPPNSEMKYRPSSQTRSPQHHSITAQRCGGVAAPIITFSRGKNYLAPLCFFRGHQHGACGRLVTHSEYTSCPQDTLNLQGCLFIHVSNKCKTVLPTHILYSWGSVYVCQPICLFLILLFFVTVQRNQLTSGQSALTLPFMWWGQSCH